MGRQRETKKPPKPTFVARAWEDEENAADSGEPIKFTKCIEQIEEQGYLNEKDFPLLQKMALVCLQNGIAHNNFDQANQMIACVRKKLERAELERLISWFMNHGPFEWRKTEDKHFPGGMKFRKATKNTPEFGVAAAEKTKWYNTEPAAMFKKEEPKAQTDEDDNDI